MANSFNYTFDNITRIGTDNCSVDQRSIQNTNSNNYMLQNYFTTDCSMKSPITLATSQPGVFYRGGHMGSGGCNIEENSNLLLGGLQTNPKCRIDLLQRPYLTVPFLGKGAVDPILESQLMQGDQNTNKKTVTGLGELNYSQYKSVPLIPELKKKANDPQYIVESSSNVNFTRGGASSREMTKNKDFYNLYHQNQSKSVI
jgi:hypothetical protein